MSGMTSHLQEEDLMTDVVFICRDLFSVNMSQSCGNNEPHLLVQGGNPDFVCRQFKVRGSLIITVMAGAPEQRVPPTF